MKTKKLMVALLALGAYCMGNAQSTYEWTQVGATPTTALSRSGSISITPTSSEGYGLSVTNTGLNSFYTTTATPMYSYSLNTTGFKYNYNNGLSGNNNNVTNTSIGVGRFIASSVSPIVYEDVSLNSSYLELTATTPDGESFSELSNDGTLKLATPSSLGNVNAISVRQYGRPEAQFTVSTYGDITTTGTVKIGSSTMTTPTGYGLYVENGVLTSKVKVAVLNSTNWSDFVFAGNYKLKPLKEVESYINANKHLPDVPSANEMVSTGLDVAKSDALLLQKIEELTLYIIELQKQVDALKK